MKLSKLYILMLTIYLSVGSPFASALQLEEFVKRQNNLVSLSGIFGELHHIRRTCVPALESTIWRDRMQNLVSLEEPDSETHLKMVTAFNDGFQKSKSLFSQCTKSAQEEGKNLAFRGATLVRDLTQPLEENTATPALQTF